MSGPIYLQRGQNNPFTDQIYQSLLTYAMIANRNKNMMEERRWQEEQYQQRKRDAVDARDKERQWGIKNLELQGKIRNLGQAPKNVDQAKQLVDAGATIANDSVYVPKQESPTPKKADWKPYRYKGTIKYFNAADASTKIPDGALPYDTASQPKKNEYTPEELVDDTRNYYSLKMQQYKDEDGYIKPEYLDEYNKLSMRLDTDMRAIAAGQKPSWYTPKQEKEVGKKVIATEEVIPPDDLPSNMDTDRIVEVLNGNPLGIYEVDGIKFRWDGQNAIPFRKIRRFKINAR